MGYQWIGAGHLALVDLAFKGSIDAVELVSVVVVFVITRFVENIEEDQQTDRETDGETDNIDGGVSLVGPEVPPGYFEVVL